MTEKHRSETERPDPPANKKPANVAPDAVMDPNEKTDGKPGMGSHGEQPDGETDPGGS